MRRLWTIWKHALGSYSEQDGYEPKNKRLIKDGERNLRMVLAKDIEEEEFRYILGRR